MASRFRVRHLHQVSRIFLDSRLVHRQVRAADGALGVSLVARPLRREFLTLSAWRDLAALHALVRAEPHHGAMRRHASAMAEATFTTWEVPVAALPASWDEAQQRLDDARSAATDASHGPGRGGGTP